MKRAIRIPALWILVDHRWWRRVPGALLLIPPLAMWVVSLMFVNAGFRIH